MWPLAIASVIGLLYCLNVQRPFHQIGFVGVFAIALFGVGTSWTYEGIISLGDVDPTVAVGLVALFVVVYAAFFTVVLNVVHFAISRVWRTLFKQVPTGVHFLGWCAGWLVFETTNYITFLDSSFPWLHLGYAFTDTWLVGLAALGGVSLVATGALLTAVGLLRLQTLRQWSLLLIGIPWIAGAFAIQHDWTEAGEDVNVALVQPNVTLAEKFEEGGLELAWDSHIRLSAEAAAADLVIWPEGSLPARVHQIQGDLHSLANLLGTTIVLGAYVEEEQRGEKRIYNGVIAYQPQEPDAPMFLKTKLVPFGEYTPFAWLVQPIREQMEIKYSDLSPGHEAQPSISIDCCTFSVSVCYEIAFPFLIAERSHKTDFLVAVSEDGWFGNSLGPAQHMQIARMRAIETGRYIVRATSSGITGVIDPKGRLVETLPQFEADVLQTNIFKMTGATPFSSFGVLVSVMAPFFTAILAALGLPLMYWLIGLVGRRSGTEGTDENDSGEE